MGAVRVIRIHSLTKFVRGIETTIKVRVEDLLDWDLTEDLEIHQGEEVRLVVLVLGHLGVVVDGKLHVREVIHGSRRIEVHDIATDAILRDLSSGESLAELALLLFAFGKHLVVHGACGQV